MSISAKLSDSEKILDVFYDYYNLLLPLASDEKQNELSEIASLITKSRKKMTELKQAVEQSLDTIHIIVKLYGDVQFYFFQLEAIRKMFEQPELDPNMYSGDSLSQTYKMQVSDYFHKELEIGYRAFIRAYKEADEKFLAEQLKLCIELLEKAVGGKEERIVGVVEELSNEYKLNYYTVDLIVGIFDFIHQYIISLDIEKKQKKSLNDFVQSVIETMKDDVLGEVVGVKVVNKKRSSCPRLQRFGLIPNGNIMGFSDAMKLVTSHEGVKHNAKSIGAAISSKNIIVILLDSITYQPIYYNISRLMNEKLPMEARGVDKYFIELTKTVQNEGKSEGDMISIEYEIYSGMKVDFTKFREVQNNQCYVLERIENADKWRFLTPWITPMMYGIPGSKLYSFILQLEGNVGGRRCEKYHLGKAIVASQNMFLPRKVDVEYESENAGNELISRDLILKLGMYIDEKYGKAVGGDGVSLEMANQIVHDGELGEIALRVMVDHLRGVVSGSKMSPELLSSFLVDLKALIGRFMKLLHDGVNRNGGGVITKETILNVIQESSNIILSGTRDIYSIYLHKKKLWRVKEGKF
jgi:hypothetical protein